MCNRTVGRSFVLSKNQARAVRRSSYLLWKKWRPRKRRSSTNAFCWTVIFQLTSVTSSARVDRISSQSRVISKSRCRANLHCIFKHAQRHSRDIRFFLLLGGSDQLVGNKIAPLSSCGEVILSEVLSPDFEPQQLHCAQCVAWLDRCW